METLLKILGKTLNEERKMYEEYLETAERERQALIKNDINEVKSIAAEKEKFIEKIAEFEDKRILITGEIEERTEKKGPVKFSEIIEEYSDGKLKETLRKIKTALDATLRKVARAQALNAGILHDSIAFINKSVEIIAGSGENKNTYSHGKNEKSRAFAGSRSLFNGVA
ncbi:MAG: flagellar protein FlgN [Fibrobacterota bacterium]